MPVLYCVGWVSNTKFVQLQEKKGHNVQVACHSVQLGSRARPIDALPPCRLGVSGGLPWWIIAACMILKVWVLCIAWDVQGFCCPMVNAVPTRWHLGQDFAGVIPSIT